MIPYIGQKVDVCKECFTEMISNNNQPSQKLDYCPMIRATCPLCLFIIGANVSQVVLAKPNRLRGKHSGARELLTQTSKSKKMGGE